MRLRSWPGGCEPGNLGQCIASRSALSRSVDLRHKFSAFQCCPVIIDALLGSFGQLDLFSRQFFVGNQTQQVCDAIQSRPSLVVRMQDMPGSVLRFRRVEHLITNFRVLIRPTRRWKIHRTQLPLPQGIITASLKPSLLFIVARQNHLRLPA